MSRRRSNRGDDEQQQSESQQSESQQSESQQSEPQREPRAAKRYKPVRRTVNGVQIMDYELE